MNHTDVKPFRRNCLKCRKPFEPIDRRDNWICPKCNKDNEKVRTTGSISTEYLRGQVPNFDED